MKCKKNLVFGLILFLSIIQRIISTPPKSSTSVDEALLEFYSPPDEEIDDDGEPITKKNVSKLSQMSGETVPINLIPPKIIVKKKLVTISAHSNLLFLNAFLRLERFKEFFETWLELLIVKSTP